MNSINILAMILLWKEIHEEHGYKEVKNIITAGLLIQIASTIPDEHSKAALQHVAGRLFESYTKQ